MEVRHDRSRAAARCRVPHPSRDTIRDDRMDRLELAPRPKYRECLAPGTTTNTGRYSASYRPSRPNATTKGASQR